MRENRATTATQGAKESHGTAQSTDTNQLNNSGHRVCEYMGATHSSQHTAPDAKHSSTRCCPTHEMWELPTPLMVSNRSQQGDEVYGSYPLVLNRHPGTPRSIQQGTKGTVTTDLSRRLRRHRAPPPPLFAGKSFPANLDDKNPSTPISSGLLVQVDEGIPSPVVDLIEISTAAYREVPFSLRNRSEPGTSCQQRSNLKRPMNVIACCFIVLIVSRYCFLFFRCLAGRRDPDPNTSNTTEGSKQSTRREMSSHTSPASRKHPKVASSEASQQEESRTTTLTSIGAVYRRQSEKIRFGEGITTEFAHGKYF
ncbi:hypothetical protein F511_19262 [Dorcoceras hygrometricum]|uniref:Uncharacterized protein n=1 Tax=Dorcoceras hygrometricum TaxID=472368 RepID=A0A2Z7B7P0_9LAMI|nr:hypothetical protein F511_19262 [Dorcoceras hygrometricum]